MKQTHLPYCNIFICQIQLGLVRITYNSKRYILDWYGKVLVGNAQAKYLQAHIFHQSNATIRSV